jgi:hypothetical protein
MRTHDPSVRASEGSSCLRLLGHCNQPSSSFGQENQIKGGEKRVNSFDADIPYFAGKLTVSILLKSN